MKASQLSRSFSLNISKNSLNCRLEASIAYFISLCLYICIYYEKRSFLIESQRVQYALDLLPLNGLLIDSVFVGPRILQHCVYVGYQ